jgi:hypothetical protein
MAVIREAVLNKDFWIKRFVIKKTYIGLEPETHMAVYVENEFIEEKLPSGWQRCDKLIRICSEPNTIYEHYDLCW